MLETTRVLILMYHRVAQGVADPWSLCVAPENFESHLRVLNQEVRVRSLPEAVAVLERGAPAQDLAVVTFDDGYRDNLTHAMPLLQEYAIPATVFVTSGYIGGGREFWWDELESVLFGADVLPGDLDITVANERFTYRLATERTSFQAMRAQHKAWRYSDAAPSERHLLFLDLWRRLAFVAADEQRRVLDSLWNWSDRTPHVRETHAVMSVREVQALAASGQIAVGAHTVTHPRLTAWSLSHQQAEVVDSKASLERMTGRDVGGFAYPYGIHDDLTAEIVERAGFRYACSTVGAVAGPGAERFRLPRVEVRDWCEEEFAGRLRSWLGYGRAQARASPFL